MFAMLANGKPNHLKLEKQEFKSNAAKGISFCKTCIDFSDKALDYLLNYILQIGVVGSCGEICQFVEQKTGRFILT